MADKIVFEMPGGLGVGHRWSLSQLATLGAEGVNFEAKQGIAAVGADALA